MFAKTHKRLEAIPFAVGALALMAGLPVMADVYLLNSDGCDPGTGNVSRPKESSFVTNNLYASGTTKWGWSDGNDPNDQTDYLINGQSMVRAIPAAGETLWFPGRKLTLEKGLLSVVNDGGARSVGISNLLIKVGSLLPTGNQSLNVYGTITIDASAYGYPSKVANNGSRWYQAKGGPTFSACQHQGAKQGTYLSNPITRLYATMVAAQPNNVAINGTTPLSWHTSQQKHYMSVPGYLNHFGFDGDCSAYFATNCVWPKTTVTVNTPDFGGSFALSNLSQVVVGPSNATVRIRGGILSRDGCLEVQSGKTMEVGDLDFAFAGPASYVAADGTNTYTETMYDPNVPFTTNIITRSVQYMNWVHNVSWLGKLYRNTIWLGWSSYADTALFPANGVATLKTAKAKLQDTLVISGYEGSTMTVGDLTLDGAKLDYSGKCYTIIVTNSLTVLGKVKVTPPSLGSGKDKVYRKALMTLAKDKGHFDLNDFELPEGHDVVSHPLVIEETAAGETLYYEDKTFDPLTAAHGYVTLTKGEDAKNVGESLYTAGYWSDGLPPHADTNYYAGSNPLMVGRNLDHTFPGKVLVGRFLRFNSAARYGTLTIKDFRFLCNSTNPNTMSRIYADSPECRAAIAGDMTVLPTGTGCDGIIECHADDGSYALTFHSTLHGWTNAVLEIRGLVTDGVGGPRFVGDNSDYRGLFRVRPASHLTLGGGAMPGTVRLQAAGSGLTVAGADGATAVVGALIASNVNATATDIVRVTVAPTNALCVSALELNGQLRKLGTGVFGAKTVTANALDAEAATIAVNEGFLRTYAPGAFDGVPLTFASGAGIAVALDEADVTLKETGFKTTGPMTSTGTFKVKIMGDFSDPGKVKGRTVTLMTVPTAFADAVEDRLRVARMANGLSARVNRSSAGEGFVTFTALIEPTGMAIVVR